MLKLNHTALHKIKLHAMQTYPEECCGVLIGKVVGETRRVCDVLEIGNAKGENRTRRFLITPADYQWAEKKAGEKGVELLGFYHSHPDHPAQPSQYDLDHAMPWCSYVITSVVQRLPDAVRSWVLRDDRSAFNEEVLAVEDGEFGHACVEQPDGNSLSTM